MLLLFLLSDNVNMTQSHPQSDNKGKTFSHLHMSTYYSSL